MIKFETKQRYVGYVGNHEVVMYVMERLDVDTAVRQFDIDRAVEKPDDFKISGYLYVKIFTYCKAIDSPRVDIIPYWDCSKDNIGNNVEEAVFVYQGIVVQFSAICDKDVMESLCTAGIKREIARQTKSNEVSMFSPTGVLKLDNSSNTVLSSMFDYVDKKVLETRRMLFDSLDLQTNHSIFERTSDSFVYQMLSRLKCDCNYYLNTSRSVNALYFKSVGYQIQFMLGFYYKLYYTETPEWLTIDDIKDYYHRML